MNQVLLSSQSFPSSFPQFLTGLTLQDFCFCWLCDFSSFNFTFINFVKFKILWFLFAFALHCICIAGMDRDTFLWEPISYMRGYLMALFTSAQHATLLLWKLKRGIVRLHRCSLTPLLCRGSQKLSGLLSLMNWKWQTTKKEKWEQASNGFTSVNPQAEVSFFNFLLYICILLGTFFFSIFY